MLTVISVTGCLNKVDESKVVLKVGSKVFSSDDINERISSVQNPSIQEYFKDKQNVDKLLDEIAQEEILYQMAKKDRLQQTPEFKKQIDTLERQALIQLYIKRNVDDTVQVSPDEVETFYNSNKAQFFDSYESRNLSHILVENKTDANKVQRLLKRGKSFGSLAKQYSKDPRSKEQGGVLGWVRKEQLVKPFGEAAYRLTKRAPVSGIVKTDFGLHIIKLNDVKKVPEQPLTDVYEQISTQLLGQKRQEKFNSIITNGKESVNIEKTLDNF